MVAEGIGLRRNPGKVGRGDHYHFIGLRQHGFRQRRMLPINTLEGAAGEQGVVELLEAGVFQQRPDEVAEGQPVPIPQEVVLVLVFLEGG